MQLPRELILIRHGESIGNVANRASRHGDHSHFTPDFRKIESSEWPLSSNGKRQGIACGNWLVSNGFNAVDLLISSPFMRAKMTAELLGLPNPIIENDLVRERDWAALDRLPFNERSTAFGGHIESRALDPYNWAPPGGESIADVVTRVQLFFDELRGMKSARGRVSVVCHGETIKAFRALIEGIQADLYREIFLEGGVRDKIYNCHALIYRRNEGEDYFSSARSVCTYDPKRLDSGWYTIPKVESA